MCNLSNNINNFQPVTNNGPFRKPATIYHYALIAWLVSLRTVALFPLTPSPRKYLTKIAIPLFHT